MPVPAVALTALTALGSMVAMYIAGRSSFVDTGCANIEAVLPRELVGQELALQHLTDAVCQHLSQQRPKKPLVISVHGPPGVGKTFTHLWLARCLYNKQPSTDLQCPGPHCRGYKVVYGLDYLVVEAGARLAALRDEVARHLAASPDSLLVVEEYDKLSCEARGLWRQLLQHPERANITTNRAIILMESNLGMAELEELLSRLGDRSKVTLEAAEQLLRDVVFAQWRASRCEAYEDTLKLMSLIDAFLPYLPLQREHMPQLVALALQERRKLLLQRRVLLRWAPEVPGFLADQVQYQGPYPLDGAKVVEPAITRQIARPLRTVTALPGCQKRPGCRVTISVSSSRGGDERQLKLSVRNSTAAELTAATAAGKAAEAAVGSGAVDAPDSKRRHDVTTELCLTPTLVA